jgi:hypothetical protein
MKWEIDREQKIESESCDRATLPLTRGPYRYKKAIRLLPLFRTRNVVRDWFELKLSVDSDFLITALRCSSVK